MEKTIDIIEKLLIMGKTIDIIEKLLIEVFPNERVIKEKYKLKVCVDAETIIVIDLFDMEGSDYVKGSNYIKIDLFIVAIQTGELQKKTICFGKIPQTREGEYDFLFLKKIFENYKLFSHTMKQKAL